MIHYPTRLNAKLAALPSVVANADTAPTQQAYDVFQELSGRIDRQIERWRGLVTTEVAAFNQLIRSSEVPAVVP